MTQETVPDQVPGPLCVFLSFSSFFLWMKETSISLTLFRPLMCFQQICTISLLSGWQVIQASRGFKYHPQLRQWLKGTVFYTNLQYKWKCTTVYSAWASCLIFAFYYTRVRPQCDYSILGRSGLWCKRSKKKQENVPDPSFFWFWFLFCLVVCLLFWLANESVVIFTKTNQTVADLPFAFLSCLGGEASDPT